MFKTGPITRVINSIFKDMNILTFYGIRKCESVARSKYKRTEDDGAAIKIIKQKVASPIFFWLDADIWLYLLGEKIDFNDAYQLGYDRVGCWCCPNNNPRAQFLAKIYMPDESKKWRDFLVRLL
jgi:phosphoadenosine phosphosulfate reductase